MKVFVYAIYSSSADIIYVGITQDIAKRLNEHNIGKSRYTKALRPWICFYSEEFPGYSDARIREKQLKNASGKEYLREKLAMFHGKQSR